MNPITATRANHALEHATITLMLRARDFKMWVAGRSTPSGFYVYGDLGTDEIKRASAEALQRLQGGEAELAISPFCGTNLAMAGLLTAGASVVALRRGVNTERVTNAILGATLAAMVAQPVGRFVQKYATTSPDLSQATITGVQRLGGPVPAHQIRVHYASR